MAKRKDYLRMFVNYAKKHRIWFEVCSDGGIGEVEDIDIERMLWIRCTKFGTKSAYEQLVSEHEKAVESE